MSSEVVWSLIEGQQVPSKNPLTIDVINPSNGRICAQIPAGCDEDADGAVSSSRRAFDDGRWSDMPPSAKRRILLRMADVVEAAAPSLDLLDAEEMGKPVSQRMFDAAASAELIRYYAESVDKVTGDVFMSDKGSMVAERRVPRGVVGAVVPWNFPMFNAALKVAPALAAGNSVVLKPSELSSRSAVRFAELALEAGVPPGTFNVALGCGQVIGRALGLHPNLDMIAFTGSTKVGGMMLEYSGRSNLKPVVAECGGKCPQILFADGVDVRAASDSIAEFLVANQGQICSVGSRLLVQRAIEREVIDRIVSKINEVVIGSASKLETTFGPLASENQSTRVMTYIDSAQDEGAELVTGGRRVLRESGGFFVAPTVFRSVPSRSRLAQEEIFGPVLSVITFEDEQDAIRKANDTAFGLSAYVWTNNLTTAMRLTKGIRSSVFVNAVVPKGEGAGNACSFEPGGHSGIGVEGGLAGMESYMQRRFVWINHG